MLADYYGRSAVAAAQVIQGFDETWFRSRLESTPVGISVAVHPTPEETALTDLLIRIVARVYPVLAIVGESSRVTHFAKLASAINPSIELADEAALGVAVGDGRQFADTIYVGSDGWEARLSTRLPQSVGVTTNPFGAGVAACIAAAWLFRAVFLPREEAGLALEELRFSALSGDRVVDAPGDGVEPTWHIDGDAVLVGAGAIGHGALWALSRAPLEGRLHVVDMERIELSNLQRYVLAERVDEGRGKTELAAALDASVRIIPHAGSLAAFLTDNGYRWPIMLLALDNARDRVGAQASLPRFIANAWTQPGDLGVSLHSRFGGDGACVGCLYLPETKLKNEDELVAATLGIPQFLMQVRTLLATGQPVDTGLLQAIAQAINQPLEVLLPFEGRTVRELYVEGFCGGAVVPAGAGGRLHEAAGDVHVPLAHQSALAGVLLAAALVRHATQGDEDLTNATRIDVLNPVGRILRQPVRARRDGRCMCDDADFVVAYATKYG